MYIQEIVAVRKLVAHEIVLLYKRFNQISLSHMDAKTMQGDAKQQLQLKLADTKFIPANELVLTGDVDKPVGKGSYGVVYRGLCHSQDVAIKVLHFRTAQSVTNDSSRKNKFLNGDKKLQLLYNEVRMMRQFRHENVVSFLGVALDPPCIVTEFCEQGSLFDVIRRARRCKKLAKKFTWKQKLKMALGAAKGMQYLHDRDPVVLHADLKSPNLLVDSNWEVKVADFGTSRYVDPELNTENMSAENPCWLAPEILECMPNTKASDVYPMGIIMWELMTLRKPFSTNSRKLQSKEALYGAIVFRNERPAIPEDLHKLPGGFSPVAADYIKLMTRCWDVDPFERPSYSEVVQELGQMLDKIQTPPSLELPAKAPQHCCCDIPRPASFTWGVVGRAVMWIVRVLARKGGKKLGDDSSVISRSQAGEIIEDSASLQRSQTPISRTPSPARSLHSDLHLSISSVDSDTFLRSYLPPEDTLGLQPVPASPCRRARPAKSGLNRDITDKLSPFENFDSETGTATGSDISSSQALADDRVSSTCQGVSCSQALSLTGKDGNLIQGLRRVVPDIDSARQMESGGIVPVMKRRTSVNLTGLRVVSKQPPNDAMWTQIRNYILRDDVVKELGCLDRWNEMIRFVANHATVPKTPEWGWLTDLFFSPVDGSFRSNCHWDILKDFMLQSVV